jgi:glycosyltransferase involved in cell wall biosynthesis
MSSICIVTTRHISYNPRVLKEADALAAAGHTVTVVALRNDERQAAFDDELMRGRSWTLRTVNFRKKQERFYWLYLSVKQRFFLYLSRFGRKAGIAERAAEKAFDSLAGLARSVKADLYIAHHAEALGPAHRAARKHGAIFGFDAEDFHTGMNPAGVGSREDRLVAFLEAKYLSVCTYMTVASTGIADAYQTKYRLASPCVILNVFPYEELPEVKTGDVVKFYWFSQVIGPNRGIEPLLEAASRISQPFELHLRGRLQSEEYREKLEALCGGSGVWDRVFLHDPIIAGQLIGDANRFDIGLALESGFSMNNNLAVSNKLFSYLMSRLPVIATDTDGQKDIFRHFPGAGRICRMNDASDLAAAMTYYILNRDELMAGKAAAAAAVKQFNWEQESKKLLGYIEEALCQKS